jgi:hypothetical protein
MKYRCINGHEFGEPLEKLYCLETWGRFGGSPAEYIDMCPECGIEDYDKIEEKENENNRCL